ncbi:MAG: MFS transporter [Magnetococcales bacterium]|nr:MFS transporter [Magnetococcales bacterium]
MRRKASTTIIFLTVFLDLLGFGIVLPLMPLYALDPRFAASPAQIGWLMAIYSIMQFVFAPLWGRFSDRIGRRPVLIIGLFGSCISYLVYGLAGSLTVLFIGRAVAGIMGANISVAQAAMADLTSHKDRAKAMGMIGAAFGLGFVIGPAMGAFLSEYGLEVAPLVAAAITGLNAIAALFLLAETHVPGQNSSNKPEITAYHPFAPSRWRMAAQYGNVVAICGLMGLFIAMFSAFEVVLPLWGNEFIGWNMADIGWVFVYVGVIAVIIQGGIIRRLTPKIGEKNTTTMGLVLVGVGLAMMGIWGKELVWVSLAIVAAGSGLVHPGFSSLVSINSDAAKQGMMMGLFQSMSALGRGVGPVVGGIIYGTHKGGVLLFAAIGIGVVLLLFLWVARNIKNACQVETKVA